MHRPRNGPFRVRIEAGQCGWRLARISRRITRPANQFMFCGLAIPRSERHRENKRGLDMGSRLGGWCRSTDFVIVVPGPLWRKIFLQKWASGKKGPTAEGNTLEEKNQTLHLRNEAHLNCVSLRSQLDYEVTCSSTRHWATAMSRRKK